MVVFKTYNTYTLHLVVTVFITQIHTSLYDLRSTEVGNLFEYVREKKMSCDVNMA